MSEVKAGRGHRGAATWSGRAIRGMLCTISGLLLALTVTMSPAGAAPVSSVAVWEKQLERAGSGADYESAAAIITGPIVRAANAGVEQAVADRLRSRFGDNGFLVDTISVLSSAENGERRLFVLFRETTYAFLFVVFHKPAEEWIVLSYSLEPSYPAIRQQF